MYPPVHGRGSGWCPHSRPGGLPCSAFCPGQHALLASGSLIDGDPGSVPPQGLPAGQSGSSGLGPCSWAPPPLLAPSPRGEAAADPECPTGGLLLGTSSQITRTTAAQGWQDFILGAPKSLQMVTAAMKLKDSCSLEKSCDQPR